MKEKLFKKGITRRLLSAVLALSMVLGITTMSNTKVYAAAYAGPKTVNGLEITVTGDGWFFSDNGLSAFYTCCDHSGIRVYTLNNDYSSNKTHYDKDVFLYDRYDYITVSAATKGVYTCSNCGATISWGITHEYAGPKTVNGLEITVTGDGWFFSDNGLSAFYTCCDQSGIRVYTLNNGYTSNKTHYDKDVFLYDRYDYITVSAATKGVYTCSNCGATISWGITHDHKWEYKQDGAALKAYCTETDGKELCDYQGEGKAVSLTLTASDANYSGKAATITVGSETEQTAWTGAELELPTVHYVGREGTDLEDTTTAPTTAGKYTAKITAGDETASVDFEIKNHNLTLATTTMVGITLDDDSFEFDSDSIAAIFAQYNITPKDTDYVVYQKKSETSYSVGNFAGGAWNTSGSVPLSIIKECADPRYGMTYYVIGTVQEPHQHTNNYGVTTTTSTNDTLTWYCGAGCPTGAVDAEHAVKLTLSASSANYSGSSAYDGAKIVDADDVEISNYTNNKWNAAGLDVPIIEIYKATKENGTEGTEKVTDLTGLAVGNYFAAVTVGTGDNKATVKKAFKISSDNWAIVDGYSEDNKETNNGYVTYDKSQAQMGTVITMMIYPNEGYHVADEWHIATTVSGGQDVVTLTKTSDAPLTYTFTMPNGSVKLYTKKNADVYSPLFEKNQELHKHDTVEYNLFDLTNTKYAIAYSTDGTDFYYFSKSGVYYLDEDITLDKNLYVGANTTICLNGHTLNLGGFTIRNESNLTIEDCTGNGIITGGEGYKGNSTSIKSQGGAICNTSSGTLTVKDITISGNSAANYGGAIVNRGIATLNNIVIENNSAKMGGAIMMWSGTLNIIDSTITGNTTTSGANAMYYYSGTVNLSGKCIIYDNNMSNGMKHNVYIASGKSIGSFDLTEDSKIGISMAAIGEFVLSGASSSDAGYFKSDSANYDVVYSEGKLSLKAHDWEYSVSADGNAVEAYCKNSDCSTGTSSTKKVSVILSATSQKYSGTPITKATIFADVDFSTFNVTTSNELSLSDIKIYASEDTSKTTELSQIEAAGTYVAYLTKGTAIASLTFEVEKADGPEAPTGLTGVKPSVIDGEDGKITGVDETMEYSTDGGKNWTAVSKEATEITGLKAGDVLVRVMETETTKAGAEATVTVPAGTREIKNGLVYDEDAIWRYYTDDQWNTEYKGIAPANGWKFYVSDGYIGWDYTGLAYQYDEGQWYYVTKGMLDPAYSGIANANGWWFAVENGQINWNRTGLIYDYNTQIWYYVTNGMLDTGFTGLAYVNNWWFNVKDGQIDWEYTGLVYQYSDGVWYYVEKGLLAPGFVGLSYVNNWWFAVENGQINWNYTGLMYQLSDDTCYYVTNGMLDTGYVGLTYYNDWWYYVENGRINYYYTGETVYNGTTFWVEKGMLVIFG